MSRPTATTTVQRCACGGSSPGGGTCAACAGKEEGDDLPLMQRAASGEFDHPLAPPSVHSVLASPGAPLDQPLRLEMENHFGVGFGSVRVHTDGRAAESADEVNAIAYTVGANVVFGHGAYAPSSPTGRRLLAHELTHVVQQGGALAGQRRDSMDVTPSPTRVARDDKESYIELELLPNCPPGFICAIITNGPKQHQPLSEADKAAITQATGAAAPPGTLTFSKDGPRFVLHDTATTFGPAATEATHLNRLKAEGSTPVGEGAAAYVTAAGAPFQAHSAFYNPQRATATEFERANDLMDLKTRETNMQLIWSLTSAAEQTKAIAAYLALFPRLAPRDVSSETAKAMKNLDSSQTRPNGTTASVFTTAGGAVSKICDSVVAKGAAAVAVAGKDTALDAACKVMRPVFAARSTRIAESTNVEIVAEKGTDCDASASAARFTPYPPAAYDAVANLYLKAALEAGQFPEITTHYFLDSTTPAGSPGPITKSQNRCDPRCFDLDLLYSKIAKILGHGKGSTYGVPAIYGTTWGTSTVWWPQQVCGTGRGTPAPSPPKTKTKQQVPSPHGSTSGAQVPRNTTEPHLARMPDDDKLDAGVKPPSDAGSVPASDAGIASSPTTTTTSAVTDAGTPPSTGPTTTSPASTVTAGGHKAAPAGSAACPDAPPIQIVVLACSTAPAAKPPAKETAELPAPTPGRFGGDAERAQFAKDLAKCRADRVVKEEIEKRYRTDVSAAKKKATAESKTETEEAIKAAAESVEPKDKRAIAKARTKAASDAKKAAAKKIADAEAAVAHQTVAAVTTELATKFEEDLATDYDLTIAHGLGRYAATWRHTMQAALDRERKRITAEKTAKPRVPRGTTPSPAKTPDEIAAAIEADMIQPRCNQKMWALDQLEWLKHGWAVARREEVDFDTLSSAKYLKDLKPTYEVPAAERVEIPKALQSESGMATIAPEVATFLTQLAADPTCPPFKASTYGPHGLGVWGRRGFSVDLHLEAPLDQRGFWRVSTAIQFLVALDAAAKALGARWRVLYNDFRVADAINSATGTRNVGFVADSAAPDLNWHGPLVLHMHLDLEIPKAPPPAPAKTLGTPSPAAPKP
ncbi:MAG TPA: DUF4157 domain-containing protein [Gemmatimonadaceae bacterium]